MVLYVLRTLYYIIVRMVIATINGYLKNGQYSTLSLDSFAPKAENTMKHLEWLGKFRGSQDGLW